MSNLVQVVSLANTGKCSVTVNAAREASHIFRMYIYFISMWRVVEQLRCDGRKSYPAWSVC